MLMGPHCSVRRLASGAGDASPAWRTEGTTITVVALYHAAVIRVPCRSTLSVWDAGTLQFSPGLKEA